MDNLHNDSKNHKLNTKQQKNIINNFGSFFETFLSEYKDNNKNWVVNHLMRTVFLSLIQLKHYIDDPNDSDVSWKTPYCELQYPVEIDWNDTNLASNTPKVSTIYYKSNNALETAQDFAALVEKSFAKSKDITLFRELTEDIVFIVKDKSKNIKMLLPRDVLEYIAKAGSMEARNNTIKMLSTKEFQLPLTDITDIIWKELEQSDIIKEDIKQLIRTSRDKQNSDRINNIDTTNVSEDLLIFSFSGLTINLDEKKAYYPISIGLFLPSLKLFPFLTDIDKNIFFKHLLAHIETALSNITEQEKYPERDFTTLRIDNDTFAIPSNPLMFTLLAMFAGRPERIPRKLLDKPHKDRTPEEKAAADKFINSVFDKQTTISYDSKGNPIEDNKIIAVISDNPKVEAKTEIGTTLFGDDLNFKEGSLAIYIKRTFGAEGLRHLLGILIGMDDAGRTGEFVWSVNEHLDRLGYKKMQNGAYAYELKQTALEIVKIFTSLFITASNKNAKGTGKISGRRLFHIEGFEKEYKENWIVDEKLIVKASDYWYKNSFESSDGSSQQFTKLLKEIARENHREHALTIYLAPLLAVFWRINSESRDFTVKNLLEWCDIDLKTDCTHKARVLKDVESELEYMRLKGYLGSWENKTSDTLPSQSTSPLTCVLSFYPPDWLREELKPIHTKKEKFLETKQKKQKEEGTPPLNVEEFKSILQNSKLSNRQFANIIGVSPALITRLLNKERAITQSISLKIRSAFESVDK